MDNPPLVLVSSKYNNRNFFYGIEKPNSFYIKLNEFLASNIRKSMIQNKVNDSILNCIFDTVDIETRKFLLESIVPDYVHPTINELEGMLRCYYFVPEASANDEIKKQMEMIKNFLRKYHYISLLYEGKINGRRNFEVFDINNLYVSEVEINDDYDLFSFHYVILVHKSLMNWFF